MTRRRARVPFVVLARLVDRRAIEEGRVIVDGRMIANTRALVRRDAAIRVEPERRLRGEAKLGAALDALPVEVRGVVAAPRWCVPGSRPWDRRAASPAAGRHRRRRRTP